METEVEVRHHMESGGELRQYIEVLIKHRWLIIAATILAALVAFVASSLTVIPTYEATAGILIAQTRSQITFDPRFQTVDSGTGASYYASLNQQARREALAALVENGAIAAQVAERLKGELDPEERNPARLLKMVSGQLRETGARPSTQTSSDFIEIKVKSSDPAKAARIANTWAEVYEEFVNELYSKKSESYASVQKQVTTAQATYEQSQEALADFTAENRIDDLNRLIAEKQHIINSLQSAKQTAVTTVIDEEVKDMLQSLSDHYATKRKMEQLLEDARALYAQVLEGGAGGAATNSLAILMLKAEIFSSSTDLPGELQLQLEMVSGINVGASAQQADVEALIGVLEDRIAELEQRIAEESAALLGGDGYDFLSSSAPLTGTLSGAIQEQYPELSDLTAAPLTQAIEKLQEELRGLQAKLEKEEAAKQKLTRARDLAWETYSTLQVKAEELGIATEMVDVEVRFASPAVEPAAPINSPTRSNVVLAAVVGLMLGVGVAFLLHYLDPEYDSSAAIGALLRRPRGAA